MAKTYSVWIEIEEYDDATEENTSMEGYLDFASTRSFPTIEQAVEFAEALDCAGKDIQP
jgi:hypothetical protein